ncbi:amphi-Trp domain-containing protein [Desulfovibrio aminophilus]|nr:amphi-Trp domain-containing protein [Desulfovibrio aminophilus]MCM0756440.1 amphi-Trp domain-containing protein [Desulfovibrio aminophilus]
MGDEKFTFESLQDPRTIRDYLQSVIDGIDKGRVILSTEDQEIVLHPASLLKFTVKAKKKSDGGKLNLAISWKEVKREALKVGETISISS